MVNVTGDGLLERLKVSFARLPGNTSVAVGFIASD